MIDDEPTLSLRPMNQDIKKQWVKMLRSGHFAQGANRLHYRENGNSHRFCCLGVLCELGVQAGVVVTSTTKFSWYRYIETIVLGNDVRSRIKESTTVLPASVMLWAGLSHHSPLTLERDNDGKRMDLSGLNDRMVPFADIADIIEGTF